MDTLLRFGEGSRLYTFTADDQINLASNFGDVVTQTVRMPGMSGGFNQYGNEPPPNEVGSINYSFWLYYATPAGGVAARDSVNSMAEWGLQKLYMLPQNDAGQDERFCYAIVNNISANFNSQNLNQQRMRVSMTFHVPDPFWYGAFVEEEYSLTASTTLSLDVGGNVRTQPVVTIKTYATPTVGTAGVYIGDPNVLIGGSYSSITDPAIVRIESGVETHRIDYADMPGDWVVFDCRAQTVVKNSGNGWGSMTRTRAEMLMLSPGNNSITVEGTMTGTPVINFKYYEMWR